MEAHMTMNFTRVKMTAGEETVVGTVVARRPKTREIYVLVDGYPQNDGWFSSVSWTDMEGEDE